MSWGCPLTSLWLLGSFWRQKSETGGSWDTLISRQGKERAPVMDHPEAVVAFFLNRIKNVTSLVSKRHIVEKNILGEGTDVLEIYFLPTSNDL